MSHIVYLNGECVPVARATIGVYNGGWLHGAGLFETMRAENGRVFRLDKHYDRLCASAERLLAPLDRSILPDHGTLASLLERNDLRTARVRVTVTADDMLRTDAEPEHNLTVCATVSPASQYSKEVYDRGVTAVVSKYRQSTADPLAGHKTTNYLARLVALNEARKAGYDEALWFTPSNLLAEASISNVFIVSDGVVSTPPTDTPVLPGLARGLVLELCVDGGIQFAQRSITMDDLLGADEVFLTNSIMQILPVWRVEKREIGDGKPGPVTRGLTEQYRARVAHECRSDA